ncbi:pyridoxal phosphate-dependent transferase [Gymnopilus junonius]|uniref:Pyridoxal phosphate-dependent transferase n=1 Tax=Gymnopilus junonius TaxID=109634 RepID=A0A9P5NGE1_GYMJU|nr:pyridoxal phosphate-dependent transferase [Gymnopilus junonius]
MPTIDWQKHFKEEQPEFGHGMLKYYSMDPEYINLNSGSYGTTPKPVQTAVEALSARIESNPDLFLRKDYFPLLSDLREKLAALVNAKATDIVLVHNASMGINTILRNIEWEEGDVIFAFTTTYGSVSATIKNISDVPPHPTASIITLNYPTTHAEIVEQFRKHVQEHPAKPNKKRVAVIDSIISNPGVLLPWKEMVKICKEEGIWSLVDAAHSIGQEVGLNLTEADPDFWVSNCHKWLSGKRSCAVLYVPERNQHLIKSSIPTSTYYISPKDRPEPNSTFLEQPLEYRKWLGGEEKINAYCHDLAIEGGKRLAEILSTRLLDPTGESTLNMVNVGLPLPGSIHPTLALSISLRDKMFEHKAYSQFYYHNGEWWTRCSVQVWNELEDFEKLGQIWLQVCAAVQEELKAEKDAA